MNIGDLISWAIIGIIVLFAWKYMNRIISWITYKISGGRNQGSNHVMKVQREH